MKFAWSLELDIVVLVVLTYLISKVKVTAKKIWRDKMLLYMIFACMAMTLTDVLIEALLSGTIPQMRSVIYIAIMLYNVFTGISALIWFILSESVFGNDYFKKPNTVLVLSIPIIGMGVFAVVSYWNDMLFGINDEFKFFPGTWHVLIYLVCYSYVVAASIHAVYQVISAQDYNNRREAASILYFLGGFVMAVPFFVLSKDTPVVHIGEMLALMTAYFSFQELQIRTDNLTDMNNRSMLIIYLEERMAHYKIPTGQGLYLIMLDLDRFRNINDVYGHLEGDKALTKMAGILKSVAADYGCFVGRYGGDKFCIVHEAKTDREIIDICQDIRVRLETSNVLNKEKYQLEASIGFARYDTSIMNNRKDLFTAVEERLLGEKRIKKNVSN